MSEPSSLDDLLARLERERQAADRLYNEALTAVDRAIQPAPRLPAPPAPADRTGLRRLNDTWSILPAGAPPIDRSLKGRLRAFVWRMIGPPLQAQAAFNSTLVDHLNRTADAQEQAAATFGAAAAAVERQLQALSRFESLLVQYLQTVTLYVDTKDRALAGGDLAERLRMIEQRVLALQREVARLPEAARPQTAAAPAAAPAPGERLDSVAYVGFEDRFRGAAGEISRRVEEYLPILSSGDDVVDVGCGRGELLTLLRGKGIRARGVDANQAMVDLCRSEGLDVVQGDALAFLARQVDGSIGGLAAIQVVEHFEPAYLTRFLRAAYDKMRPGAPIVLETINAACWMAFFETYIRDLTHQRPLHPDTLAYLVQASGFGAVDVRFRQPVAAGDRLAEVPVPEGSDPSVVRIAQALNAHAQQLNARLFSSMDYAVVGRR